MSIETRRPIYDTYQQFLGELSDIQPILNSEGDDGDYDTKPGDKGPDAYSSDAYIKRGAFALRIAASPLEIIDSIGEPVLGEGERYVSIHLQELPEEQANIGFIRQSLAEVATELASPEYEAIRTIASVTYARLGHTAMRFGFEQAELPLIQDSSTNPNARPIIVHADKATFIDSYRAA